MFCDNAAKLTNPSGEKGEENPKGGCVPGQVVSHVLHVLLSILLLVLASGRSKTLTLSESQALFPFHLVTAPSGSSSIWLTKQSTPAMDTVCVLSGSCLISPQAQCSSSET